MSDAPTPSALWQWGAVELARAIRSREISSREATKSAIARMHAVNPAINAVVEPTEQAALESADAADAAVARGEATGLLHGVPVTIKINVDQKGMPRNNGLKAFADRVATDDSPVVTNLRKAGAVFLGRTNSPAFAARPFTSNEMYGETFNPWTRRMTPSGSSGGAGAAIAAGIGAIAHGNDLGGSVRTPAAACGVVGLRCTPSRIPNYNPSVASDRPYMHQSTTSQGPIARNIADTRLGFAAMAGRDYRDPWWVPALPIEERPSLPCRVALFLGPEGVAPQVTASLRLAASWLEEAGCIVEEVAPPRFDEALVLHRALLHAEREGGTLKDIEKYGDIYIKKSMASRVRVVENVPATRDEYIKAVAMRSSILRDWNAFFERYPLLLTPMCYDHGLPAEYDQQGDEAMRRIAWAMATQHVTALLALPGLSVPTGIMDGVPGAVQLVAGRLQDEFLLDAGALIEARAGTFTPIDPIA